MACLNINLRKLTLSPIRLFEHLKEELQPEQGPEPTEIVACQNEEKIEETCLNPTPKSPPSESIAGTGSTETIGSTQQSILLRKRKTTADLRVDTGATVCNRPTKNQTCSMPPSRNSPARPSLVSPKLDWDSPGSAYYVDLHIDFSDEALDACFPNDCIPAKENAT
jgi:hypothetical protein